MMTRTITVSYREFKKLQSERSKFMLERNKFRIALEEAQEWILAGIERCPFGHEPIGWHQFNKAYGVISEVLESENK